MLNIDCDTLMVVPDCEVQEQSGFAELYYFFSDEVDVATLNLAGTLFTALTILGSKAVKIPTVSDSIELSDPITVNKDAGVSFLTQTLKFNMPNPAGNSPRELRQFLAECKCKSVGFILLSKSSKYLVASPDPAVLATKVFGSGKWVLESQTTSVYGKNGATPASFDLVFTRETSAGGYALPVSASVPTTDFLA